MILAFTVGFPNLVLGAIVGVTYGALAVGLVLVFRSNRVINFAHGSIGITAGAVLGVLVERWHVPYWLAFAAGIMTGALIGAISEIAVVRRLKGAPVLMSIVATLGLAAALDGVSQVINPAGQNLGYPQPTWLPRFFIGALLVTRAYSAMLILTPLVVLGLMWFLHRSRFGLALRAASSNADAAEMAGVAASLMSTLAWTIAGALAAFTAMLLLPTLNGEGAGLFGPDLLFRALAAAVIARMESLPVALAAGVGVGIVELITLENYPGGGPVDMVLFCIVIVALLLQRQSRGRGDAKGSWAQIQPWPPLAPSLLRHRAVRAMGWYAFAAGTAFALITLAVSSDSSAGKLTQVVALGLVGLSLGIVTGLCGQLSLGQFAFAGVGGVASYLVAGHTHNYAISFLAAGAAGAVSAVVIGLPALRIRGLMLAIATLGFGLASANWLFQQSWMLGAGIEAGRPSFFGIGTVTSRSYYAFSLVVLLIALWLARNVWRTGLARRMRAVRDNEDYARAFTVSVVKVKLQALGIGGFLAGLGGAVFTHYLFSAAPSAFDITNSVNVVAMTALGGAAVLAGPLLGALYIVGLPYFVHLSGAEVAATSFGWLILILYFPGGIAQALRPVRDLLARLLASRPAARTEPADVDHAPASPHASLAPAGFGPRATTQPATTREGTNPVLDVQHVSKRFGAFTAVDAVDLRVPAGQILGIIGPNGAGKTTLFEIISGFVRPDTGRILLGGHDVSGRGPERRAQLGLVRSFQDAALFPTMTVLEVVETAHERIAPTRFLPSIIGLRSHERALEAAARQVVSTMGLDDYRDRQVRELSTGTRRVVDLACMVILRPRVLLLDEPSSGIAQSEVEALGALLQRLHDEMDLTMIVIEHDMPLIMGLSHRIVAMDLGAVIADGPPATVQANPRVIDSYLGGNTAAIGRSGTPQASARPPKRQRPLVATRVDGTSKGV
jgi:ABC-type branched-subunit amino acid transport system ATPase component/ABC-type branched-subunit amino acid transport system permease subunit